MVSRTDLPVGLLEEIKNYLDITWEDEATDQKLRGLIASGINYLNEKAGEALDYTVDSEGLTLLKDYVRYARDGALDVFENNYLHLLLSMQNNRKVKAYAAQAAISTGE